jgi:hypothetical protein
VQGSWSAQGGRLSGDGGFIETSASHLSVGEGVIVNTLAVRGKSGQWLLDPYDFTIAAGGDVTGATLTTALATGDVTITTAAGSATCSGVACNAGNAAGNGDINVNDSVTIGAGRTLTLNAYRNINLNSQIAVNADASTRLYLWFGMQGSGEAGAVVVNSGGGTTGAGTNIKGGNFATHAIPSYPVLNNFTYTAPAPAPAPVPVVTYVYVRLDEGQGSTYGDTPTLKYAIYDATAGGNSVSITPSGSVNWSTPITGQTNAGIYSLTYTGNFTLTGYSINAGHAVNWTVNPRPVTITASKTYDGRASFDSGFVIKGLVNNDTLSIRGNVSSANADTYNSLIDSTFTNRNYTIGSVTATISPKPVSATATKTYDGSTAFAASNFAVSGVLTSESVSLSGRTTTASADAGAYSGLTGLSLGSSTNYTFTGGTLSATITPKPLDIAVTKLYDTTPTFLKDFKITGTVNNESAPTVTRGYATVNAPDVGTYTSFTANSLESSNPNYTLQGGKVSASITKARLDPGFVWLMAIQNYKNVLETKNKAADKEYMSCVLEGSHEKGSAAYVHNFMCASVRDLNKNLIVLMLSAGDGAKNADWIKKTNNEHLALAWQEVLQTQLDAAGLSKGFEVNYDDIRAWLKGLTAK